MKTLYGMTEAAGMLGMNPARLKRWCDYGYYEPDYCVVLGKKTYRLFSDRDLDNLTEALRKAETIKPLSDVFHIVLTNEDFEYVETYEEDFKDERIAV